ncbi:MAG: hypothetical protein RLZZ625_1013 [Pseudomonadota bacterium]
MKKIKFYIFLIFAFNIICAHANSGNDYLIYVSVFTSSASCEKDHYGRLILSLEPHLFYNPLMKILYGGITTKVYGYNGKIITTIKSEDEVPGYLTILHEKLIDQLYKKILIKLQNQISSNEAVNLYLKQKNGPIEGTFCLMLN